MLNSTVKTPFESHTILYIYKEVLKYPFIIYCLGLYDLLNNHTTQKLLKILIIKNSFCFLLLIVRSVVVWILRKSKGDLLNFKRINPKMFLFAMVSTTKTPCPFYTGNKDGVHRIANFHNSVHEDSNPA